MTAISSIRNLGPAFEAELITADLPTAEALRALGVDADYHTLFERRHAATFHRYYVLRMAFQGWP
jgi:DNA transformation protein